MLKTGQIVKVQGKEGALLMFREMGRKRLGSMLALPVGVTFVILSTLAKGEGIEEGDYMAAMPGSTTIFLLPKAQAEGWAPKITAEFIMQGAMEAYSAVAQALGFAPTDEASPDDVVDRATGLINEEKRLNQMLKASAEENGRLSALLRKLGRVRADPACSTCGGTGNEPDGATCSCVGWVPKVDDVEVQNAVAREIAHALGAETPDRLAVTPALAAQLALVHGLRDQATEAIALLRDRDASLTPAEYRQRAEDDAARAQRFERRELVSEVLRERNGRWLMQAQLAPPDVHPADCQSCSEDTDPCSTHAEDWRYWQGRCLDAEDGHKAALEELSALGALLGWASGETKERPKARTTVERYLAQVIDERDAGLEARALRERLEPDYVRLMVLVYQLVEHLHTLAGMATDTRGGATVYRRSTALKVGDLVSVQGVLSVPMPLWVGFLEAVEPDPTSNPYLTVYQWRTLDGQVLRGHNMKVRAAPAGDLYPKGGMLEEIDTYFMVPEDQRPVGINREPRESRLAFAEHARAIALGLLDEADAETEEQAERHRLRTERLAERTGQQDFLETLRQRLGRWVPDRQE